MKNIAIYLVFLFSFPFFEKGEPDLHPFRKADTWGYCNRNGEIKISCLYDKTFPFKHGMAVVYKSAKGYGLIDENGREITVLKYSAIEILNDGVARALLDSKYVLIDQTGKEIVPPKIQSQEAK
jgi:hypothetical protein